MTTASPSPTVTHSIREGVCTITLERPPVNAYESVLIDQLRSAIEEADRTPGVGAVILRSSLPTFFSVGADIKVWGNTDVATNQHLVDAARATSGAIAGSDKIFIAAINGHALGGGLELAMACDLRFAAEGDYQLGLPEVKLGLMPGNGGTQRLLRLVGPSRALQMAATGESVDPSSALTMGLVDRLLPSDRLYVEVDAFARALAGGPREAIGAIKAAVRDGADSSLADALALEARLSSVLYETADAIEGSRAYLEKRPPRFGATR